MIKRGVPTYAEAYEMGRVAERERCADIARDGFILFSGGNLQSLRNDIATAIEQE